MPETLNPGLQALQAAGHVGRTADGHLMGLHGAAKRFGTTPLRVYAAIKVLQGGSIALINAVATGEIELFEAARLAQLPKEEQKRALANARLPISMRKTVNQHNQQKGWSLVDTGSRDSDKMARFVGPDPDLSPEYQALRGALLAMREAKPGDRSEKDRWYAVTITKLEEACAYFWTYVEEVR